MRFKNGLYYNVGYIIMDFVYPIIPNNKLPKSNPHGSGLDFFLPWSWVHKQWDDPITRNINYIQEQFPDDYLPVGTKLYHGSLEQLDFKAMKKDRITFFGLDVVISLWYILELSGEEVDTIGKLYEFIVVEPIPLRLLEPFYSHPKEDIQCRKDPIACIHPQLAYHGDTDTSPPYDLCIEITMNMKYFKDYIQLTQTYEVDTMILYTNRRKLFTEFNPVQAITGIYSYNTKVGGIRKSYKRKPNRYKSIYNKSKKHIVPYCRI